MGIKGNQKVPMDLIGLKPVVSHKFVSMKSVLGFQNEIVFVLLRMLIIASSISPKGHRKEEC